MVGNMTCGRLRRTGQQKRHLRRVNEPHAADPAATTPSQFTHATTPPTRTAAALVPLYFGGISWLLALATAPDASMGQEMEPYLNRLCSLAGTGE